MSGPPPCLAILPAPEMTPEIVAKSRPVKPLSPTLMSRQPAPLKVSAPVPKVRLAAPEAVAFVLRTKVVPLVMAATVAPPGIPVPATDMPTTSPAVVLMVTLAVPVVVVPWPTPWLRLN